MTLHVRNMESIVGPFVDGAYSVSASSAYVGVVNPSNGNRFMRIPEGCESDINLAVSATRRAFEDGRWNDVPPSVRKRTLHLLEDLLEAHAQTLDSLGAEVMGKPLSLERRNASSAARQIRCYAEAVDKGSSDVYVSYRTSLVVQQRVPRGIVAAIVPWSFPTSYAVLRLGPGLATGNCVVLKPSELSSR